MSVTTHERPGVYSEYDASLGGAGQTGAKDGGDGCHPRHGPGRVPQTVTSYEGALIAFGSTGGRI